MYIHLSPQTLELEREDTTIHIFVLDEELPKTENCT
jgi:hypothetical protein